MFTPLNTCFKGERSRLRDRGDSAPHEGILTLHCVPLLRLRLHRAFGSRAPRLRNTSASRDSLRVSGVRRSASGRMTFPFCLPLLGKRLYENHAYFVIIF